MQHLVTCPVCSGRLSEDINAFAKYKSVSCQQNHLFDYAKQGYLNLLLSQHKKSKHPGDTLDMVQARTHFLSRGIYDNISRELNNICLEHLASADIINRQHSAFHYSDLACGEGFYTVNLHHALKSSSELSRYIQQIHTTGIDISTPAIKSACKRTKEANIQDEIQWLVASLARAPIEDNSQDLVTGLFFHFDFKEIARILKQQGFFVMVTTGKNHLIELRHEIYDTLKEETPKDFTSVMGDMRHLQKVSFTEEKTLTDSLEIQFLLKMTPHYWRCTLDKKRHLEALNQLTISIDIQFDVFTKDI